MRDQLTQLAEQAKQDILGADTLMALDHIRVKYLGKKGQLTDILKDISRLSADEKPLVGQWANAFKDDLQQDIDTRKQALKTMALADQLARDAVDVTLPGIRRSVGAAHPISQVMDTVCGFFTRLGFDITEGPDIETEYHNFEALNIPSHHPSRDMHDTFYLPNGELLRTHTSPVQIRTMQAQSPPIKIVVPGTVYRCDTDITHSPMFHQIEGLVVDTHVTFAQLKGTLQSFLHFFFGPDRPVRFRPSYFPFTEPSTEVDVACGHCGGRGCASCKHSGWLEILGAGMVHRHVFEAVGYDPDTVTGFAFGMGVERLAMLKFGLSDIRWLYENDQRFLGGLS
ncbi:phenylalanine--tRNA ligase subunit alpha [bacterium]|nr:phenylalanine--tRNA ligase subunit alpha [bacterium]